MLHDLTKKGYLHPAGVIQSQTVHSESALVSRAQMCGPGQTQDTCVCVCVCVCGCVCVGVGVQVWVCGCVGVGVRRDSITVCILMTDKLEIILPQNGSKGIELREQYKQHSRDITQAC